MKDYLVKFNRLFTSYLGGITFVLVFIIVLKQLYIFPFLENLLSILTPIAIGIIIAYLVEPLIENLKMKRVFSCLIVYGIFILLLLTILFIIVYPLSMELLKLKEHLPALINYIQTFLDGTMVVNGISDDTYGMLTRGGELVLSQMASFTNFVTKAGTSLLVAFFISLDKKELLRVFKMEVIYTNTHISYFLTASSSLISRYIVGMAIDLVFLFLAFSLILLCFRFPYFWLYAIMLSLLNMIPILGPTIGFLILLLVAFLHHVPYMWLVLILVWIIQQIEANYIQVMIFKKTMNVLPIYTLVIMLVFGYYFGILGMIISPILAGMLQIAYKSYELSCESLPTWEDIWE